MALPKNGIALFVKRDCPTCVLIDPVAGELAAQLSDLSVLSQDDPGFPEAVETVIDDTALEQSWRNGIEIVPTLIRFKKGKAVERCEGWHREEWEELTGVTGLGAGLPDQRVGCGSLSVEPGRLERLEIRFGDAKIIARRIEVGAFEDEVETLYDRGWSDGLPLVPPTEERVYRMLQGTRREPQENIGNVPPDLAPCTIEKIAINAVMAGCKPEYLPVVIAAVEAALLDRFCMHGLLATTYFSGPMVMVNGPIADKIGMNAKGNAFGQGNRANATIGRALQLVIRNVGGGKPQGVDRANLGTPGKYTFCFAENEEESPWGPYAEDHGISPGTSAVTLFAADGIHPIVDQSARRPQSLINTFALSSLSLVHPKVVMACDAFLVICPEHARVFAEARWTKEQVHDAVIEATIRSGAELVRGAQGIDAGLPEALKDASLPKFKPDGLNVIHVGGGAGMFSALISGWVASGEIGSQVVTHAVGD